MSISSLSSSMSSALANSGIDDGSKTLGKSLAESYQKACKLFLLKKFEDAYEITRKDLGSCSGLDLTDKSNRKLLIRIWNLYFALIDHTITNQAATTTHTDNDGLSKQLRKSLWIKISDGSLWSEVEVTYKGLGSTSPEVIFSLLSLCLKHASTSIDDQPDSPLLQKSFTYVENYLTSYSPLTPEDEQHVHKIVEALVFKVLPLMNDFDYAYSVIDTNPYFDDPQSGKARLNEIKRDMEQQKVKKQQEVENFKRQEVLRVAEAEKRALEKNESPDVPSLHSVSPEPISLPHFTDTYDTGKDSDLTRNTAPARTFSLVRYWRSYFQRLLENRRMLQILAFLVMLVLSFGTNPFGRNKVRTSLAMIWRKLVDTIRMGTKVSYI